ncbi:MAG: inner membrane CreD family protein [Elusimicrobia bacterium]|nr:inner membrane CreD family protein [Elusimicrobiota bacterium]
MWKRIMALTFIFVCTSIAWFILGGATSVRTHKQDNKLKKAVRQLWGTIQKQQAPYVYYQTKTDKQVEKTLGDETTTETKTITKNHPIILDSSDILVSFNIEHRKKGLLWYPTYRVVYSGQYTIKNDAEKNRKIFFSYSFPTRNGIYDNFCFFINGKKIEKLQPYGGEILKEFNFGPGETKKIKITYESQGMGEWWYLFGSDVSQIRNFNLTMITDFDDIDFPENSISPQKKEKTDKGWKLTWQYADLISGIQIGMDMPQKLNPGPFVSRVSFFAPVSLFLFLFLMFIITTIKKINIHPMNYFFLSAAFFSFHLLLAYLVDHIDIHLAFAICTVVSISLVISYMRLVVGTRFALLETGLSQFVYLVLFSYAFFLEGYTGLAITICCILTLFVAMQFTGKIDWDKQFETNK